MTMQNLTVSGRLRAIDFAALALWLSPVAIAYALELVGAI